MITNRNCGVVLAPFVGALLLMSLNCSSTDSQAIPAKEEAAQVTITGAEKAGTEAYALAAGFSTVDMTWRAGAKPGQVGTDANSAQMIDLWRGIVKLLLHAYRYQTTDRPILLLEYVTQWTIDHIEDRLNEIRYDKYTDVFEPGRGLHTRAAVKAMVLESNGKKVAIARADLYLMQKTIRRRVAELVGPETGLAPEDIMITASHNHSAADAAFTAAGISTLAENFDPRHFVWITHKIAEAIIAADKAAVPARMGAIKTKMRAVQRNVIGPGTGQAIPPGETEPVDVQAGYPRDFFDDDLWILHFEDNTTLERLGAFVVYGIHPESLEEGHGLLSSDFFGLMEAGLEERWGCPVIWSPGALGDVEQDDGGNTGTDYWRENFVVLDQQAAVLVDTIGPILESPGPSDQVIPSKSAIPVDSRLSVFPGPPNTNYPGATPYMLPVTEYVSPEWPVTCVRAMTETANLVLQAVQLGDVLLLGSPSEVTSDMAIHIRSRVDDVEGNLYQGYVWPDTEAWVEDEINQNFDNSELSSDVGFAMPIVLSQANDWMGYMVTRWEFNNRHHYRQGMTLYGEDTANYLAARFEGLARDLRGAGPENVAWDEPSSLDLELEDEVYAVVANLDPWVTEWARAIPPDDPLTMGRVVKDPTYVEEDEMEAPAVHFGWKGPSSDMDIPSVAVDRALDFGVWEEVLNEADPHLWVLYRQGGYWEAVWHLREPPGEGSYRFRVKGLYRGQNDGNITPDPIWDPDGRNATYQAVSSTFTLSE